MIGAEQVRTDEGVTLVELLVVMVMSVVVLSIAGGTIVQSLRTQRREVATLEALAATRTAFERVTRDLRNANPLVAVNGNSATGTSTVDGRTRTTTYQVVARRLVVDVRVTDAGSGAVVSDPPERVLLDGVELPPGAAVFRWFSVDGAELAAPVDPDSVGSATVRLRVPVSPGARTVDLSTDVVLRNKER